jgi:hypothetical protein
MKKVIKQIVILLSVYIFSVNIYADNYAWLVHKLSSKEMKKAGFSSEKILNKLPMNTIIEIPVYWSSELCDYNKSIITFEDKIGRNVASCSYIGKARVIIK